MVTKKRTKTKPKARKKKGETISLYGQTFHFDSKGNLKKRGIL